MARPRPNGLALSLIGLAVALTIVLYYHTMTWWVTEWTQPGSFYAHGVFIPFFVGLMVWRDRERLRRLPISHSWWGLVLLIIAFVLLLLGRRAEVTVVQSLSFVIYLVGASLLLAGKAITRSLLFPMMFLLTMIPVVPDQLINIIAFPIQMTSAKMAATILNLTGFPSYRNGVSILMEHYQLNVELPCSGFKTLLGLMAFSAAFAYLVDAAKWKRWTLFLVSMPMAILVNGIRITLIGLVGEVVGTSAAASFHDYSGFIVLILGFTVLFSLARWIKCDSFLGMPLNDPPAKSKDGPEDPDAPPSEAKTPVRPPDPSIEEMNRRYGAPRANTLGALTYGIYPLVGILAIACVAKAYVHPPKATIPPLKPSELAFDLDGGVWTTLGKGDRPIAPEIKEIINPQTWIDRDYFAKLPKTGSVNLLISAGNGRRVFHDPHTCFLGSGWILRDTDVEEIQTPAGPVKVQVAEAESLQEKSKSLLMFLYVVDGKQMQTTQAVNTALIGQIFFGESGRPAYFLRFRQMLPGTDEQRRKELRELVSTVWTQVAGKVVGTKTPATQTVQR
jgi:exosortase